MTHRADRSELAPARRRRLIGLGLLRALATTVVLVALYYLLPLDHIRNVPVTLAVGLVILLAVTVVQLRIIVKARYPAVRAIEALAATVPLFLLLFASAYIAMTSANPANFSTHPLTRTDALYFTVTVFTTVGLVISPRPASPLGWWSPCRCCSTWWPWAWSCERSWEPSSSPGSRPRPPPGPPPPPPSARGSRRGRHHGKATTYSDRPPRGIPSAARE